MSTAIAIPEKELEQKSLQLSNRIRSLQVVDNASRAAMIEYLKVNKAMQAEISEAFDPNISNAYKTWKGLIATRDKYLNPQKEDEAYGKSQIIEWETEQERIRQEQEFELQKQAKALEEDRRIREAALLESEGDHERAEEIINAPVRHAPVILASPVQKVSGSSSKEEWKWRLKDRNRIPREFMIPDEKAINEVVRKLKDRAESVIPGIEVYSTKNISIYKNK